MVNAYETEKCKPIRVYCDATKNFQNCGVCSVGWIVANHNGRQLDAGGRNIGSRYSVEDAELEAIREALTALSNEWGVDHVKVYSDAQRAIDRFDEVRDEFDFEYMTADWVPREMNMMADHEADRYTQDESSGGQQYAYGTTD